MPTSSPAATPERQRSLAIALAVAAVPFAWLVWRYAFVCDDAYISFRYARHLVEGQGLRFNLGEDPPVEGYTNLLWVLWLTPFQAVGADLGTVARATSIASAAALLVLVTRFAIQRLELGRAASIATALFFATLPPISVWSTSGLETMPFALAVFAGFDALAREPARPRGVRAGICALAAALLRADGALFAFAALACGAAPALWPRRGRSADPGGPPPAPNGGTRGEDTGCTDSRTSCGSARRALLVALAVLAAGVGAHLLWRHAYHGDWLPNTAKIKAGLSGMRVERGLKYLATMGLNVPGVAIALGAAAVARGGPRRELAARALGLVAVVLAYALFMGGDFMPMARFLVPALPFVAFLFACALARWQASARGSLLIASSTALAVAAASLPAFERLPVPRAWLAPVHFRWNSSEVTTEQERWASAARNAGEWRALGRGLALRTQPGESIVLGNIGAIGYESELFIYDVFGLVSRAVAERPTPPRRLSPGHDKLVDPRFFFGEHPTYLGTYFAPAGTPPTWGVPDEWLKLLERGAVAVEELPPAAGPGVPAGHVQRLLRFDWTKFARDKSR